MTEGRDNGYAHDEALMRYSLPNWVD